MREWVILPRPICKVSGTVYHEICVLSGDSTTYPCCDITIAIGTEEAVVVDIPNDLEHWA